MHILGITFGDLLLIAVPEAIKLFLQAIPSAIRQARFKRFFGTGALKADGAYVVLDPFEHPVPPHLLVPELRNRYVKRFYGKRADIRIVGTNQLLSTCSVRVTTYASTLFSLHRPKQPVKVVLDKDILDRWDGTFLCFGSADSNIKTYEIENLRSNTLYSFEYDERGHRCFVVNNQRFQIENGRDKAVLARLKNPYHNEHYLFVCAGLGEWGTSGAAYFLFNRWEDLNKRFKKSPNFCLIVEVAVGADESAQEVFSHTSGA